SETEARTRIPEQSVSFHGRGLWQRSGRHGSSCRAQITRSNGHSSTKALIRAAVPGRGLQPGKHFRGPASAGSSWRRTEDQERIYFRSDLLFPGLPRCDLPSQVGRFTKQLTYGLSCFAKRCIFKTA